MFHAETYEYISETALERGIMMESSVHNGNAEREEQNEQRKTAKSIMRLQQAPT